MELAFRHSPVNFGDRKRQANCNRECPRIKSRHDDAAVGRFLLDDFNARLASKAV